MNYPLKTRSAILAVLFMLSACALIAQTTQQLTYDDAGRVSTVTFTQGAQRVIISYEYDGRSNLTKSTTQVVSSVSEDDGVVRLDVRPNPASSQVTVSAPASPGKDVEVKVVSSHGKVLLSRMLAADNDGQATLTFDSAEEGLTSGSYTISFSIGGSVRSATLVINK
jgi:hypothetical protein